MSDRTTTPTGPTPAARVAALHHPALLAMRAELAAELTGRILPYWMTRAADERNGGVVGLIDGDGVRHEDAPKGSIVHARVLWTFAAAHRVLGDCAYRDAADRAAAYVRARFVDPAHGGVYWMVNADGTPRDERKHVYAQAFAIYALSEHVRATGDAGSLALARELFRLVERHAHDARHGGYQEAFSRDWVLLDDVRLSDEDADERKSMNTHLHLLEAYTNLYRVWPDDLVRRRLEELLGLFLDTIVDEDAGHVRQFFDEDWTPKSAAVSYGHDIETSWLLLEAADALEDPSTGSGQAPSAAESALTLTPSAARGKGKGSGQAGLLRARARRVSLRVAGEVLGEGYDAESGGLFNEGGPDGVVDTDKEWWPQAEAIVGFVGAYQESGRETYLHAARATWAFVKAHVLDAEHGEWRHRVARDGTPRPGREKVGPWKCPYHNGRACLELIARVAEPATPAAS